MIDTSFAVDILQHTCGSDTSNWANWVYGYVTFVSAISKDLQKARISNFACKEHMVGGQSTSKFFLVSDIFPKNVKNWIF